MLTKNEITALNLSPTKKDFVQIWNELLEVAGRLSERWDPTSTNESDPGIVILKSLTGIADKLNYNIDKNTLEAFMPTAAQEESMRKLCDMLGYNVKYYRSAETAINIRYNNSDASDDEKEVMQLGLVIPKFTVITNGDQDINYFTINETPLYISSTSPTTEPIPCMEGQIVKCESVADNNVITANQISDNNRFYLPEHQIAENGIFVYNVVANQEDGDIWKKVDNLNIQARGSRVYKFGYDSYEGRPYLEFPADYSELINDGLFIYYTRTSGANGNISARTLTQLELPNGENWSKVSAESFSVENAFSATSGANIETINQAYNSFKKTIGTFETLVTCRDYMNKIYTMTDETTGKHLVSNALVTDIRTDLNRAVTICSCDDAGIFYKDAPLYSTLSLGTATKPVFNESTGNWHLGDKNGSVLQNFLKSDFGFDYNKPGIVSADDCWIINQGGNVFRTVLPAIAGTSTIDHFDLVLYPFKSYNQIRNNVKDIQASYDRSFEYNPNSTIKRDLEQHSVKTIAHNIISPREHDVVSINNYLRLNAVIGTAAKVTVEEGKLLIEKIKIALANAFNMRELDFGDEIPFDSILSVIENADARISVVSLAEPALYTTFSVFEGTDSSNNPILREYAVASDWLTTEYADASDRFEYTNDNKNSKYTYTFDTAEAKKIYNRLAVRNVLAGRVPLFKYSTTFKPSFSDGAYRVTKNILSPTSPHVPSKDNPFTIWVDGDKTFTGQYQEIGVEEVPKELKVPTAEVPTVIYKDLVEKVLYEGHYVNEKEVTYAKTIYTETAIPEEYTNIIVDNVIAKNNDDDTNFTEIEPKCEVFVGQDANGNATTYNVELADGEFIKFRAPNFITSRTYPAYVNYHLKLSNSASPEKEAVAATAKTLESLLIDKSSSGERWRTEIFKYFNKSSNKKKFTLIQTVYGSRGTLEISDDIVVKIDDADQTHQETPEQILYKSGFVKLMNNGEAKLTFASTETKTNISIPNICLHNDYRTVSHEVQTDTTQYILTSSIFKAIKDVTDQYLGSQLTGDLPAKDWTISYEFEYIPFEVASLKEWKSFIEDNASLLGFSPAREFGTPLWRIYQGSYQIGKYILPDGVSKLQPLTEGHVGLLDSDNTSRLSSVYIAEDLGRDATLSYVPNDEEYQLREGECLYIEYTPSTTTEDGASQVQEPVLEVLGKGTILKPSGFDGGLLSNEALELKGKSAHKNVDFSAKTGNSSDSDIGMYSLGASEQIAIRELSKVEINNKTLSGSPTLYVYKNFNDCAELEKAEYDDSGNRINNSYTLKDGEYIFYTDQNQTEFAYYTSGTKVTLEGRKDVVIPKCELIDIATILDNGIQAIPWVAKTFGKNDSIIFQEFQYITLGPNDTLRSLQLYDTSVDKLDDTWQKCVKATYVVAGSDEVLKLPSINLSSSDDGNSGWEACSLLELNVSPNNAQALRTTDKVKTSVALYKIPASGVEGRKEVVTLEALDDKHPLSFKTNLSCVSSAGKLSIGDIYANSDIKSFELKVLSENPPAIIKTKQGELVPCANSNITDITTWTANAEKTFANKSYGELWTRIPLNYIEKLDGDEFDDTNTSMEAYDKALKLSISVLPNTYGVFSIYLKYGEDVTLVNNDGDGYVETWIDLLPGSSQDDVTLINVPNDEIEWCTENKDKYLRLKLKPGINCIRVNKTCDLFIKTSLSSSAKNYEKLSISALYFDDLRLVECQPLEYIKNGKKTLQKTQGINLSQIGYLDTAKIDPLNTFDLQIRRNLRKEYTEAALTALDARSKTEDKKLEVAKSELQADKSKLQELVKFIDNAKTEINALNSSTTDVGELFEIYKKLREELGREEALREALINNESVSDLESQLVDLLSSLEISDNSKQELLSELDALEFAATNNASRFTKEDLSKGIILDDFEAVADSADMQLVNDLKLFSLKEVNKEYAARLADLASVIDVLDNDEAKAELLTILDNLNISKHAKIFAQFKAIVDTDRSGLVDLLESAIKHANGEPNPDGTYVVDYVSVRADLVDLREYLSSANIDELLSELNLVLDSAMANSDKYDNLLTKTNELISLLGASNPAESGKYSSLLTKIDNLLNTVQDKINKNATGRDDGESGVIKAVEDLSSTADSIYTTQLKVDLSELKDILIELESTYADVELFKDSDDTIQAILSNLEIYNAARTADIETIEDFSNSTIAETYLSLPYGVLSVLSIWPKYMKSSYTSGITKLYRDVRRAINNPTDADLIVDDSFYTDKTQKTPETLRQILATTADLAAFQQLFERAKSQAGLATQSQNRAELINALGTLITPSSELQQALEAIADDRNSVLQQLISSWLDSTKTVTEKQRLLSELTRELESVIDTDTKLVEISAKLLCPSILLFPVCNISNIEDAFYSRLCSYIISQKESLADEGNRASILSYLENAYANTSALLEAVKADDFSTFSFDVIKVSDTSETLLTKKYLEKLIKLANSLNIQMQIQEIKTSKFLGLLQEDLVVAWQDEASNWIDRYGDYYQKFTNYKDVTKPAKWVAYPVNGNAEERDAWLKATEEWAEKDAARVMSWSNAGYWRTFNGDLAHIDAKREYNGTAWLDGNNSKIEVKKDSGWLLMEKNEIIEIIDSSDDESQNLENILDSLLSNVSSLGQLNYMSEEVKEAHSALRLEIQLLDEIKELDKNREFYYNVPVEANVAIDFNESEAKLNTLMNPAVNYDINNVNNNFVISKIDINYLTNGLQIARSSKFN